MANTSPALYEMVAVLNTCYNDVEELCDSAVQHADALNGRTIFTGYLYHTRFLIAEIRMYIDDRRSVYLPYVAELSEKSSTGHNCMNCAGRCELQHTASILEMVSSLRKLESTVSYIQSELEAIYAHEQLKGSLRALNAEVQGLIDRLNNTLQYEEMNLVPGVKGAQTSINAHS